MLRVGVAENASEHFGMHQIVMAENACVVVVDGHAQ